MNTYTGQKRSFRIVCAILLISMLLDKYFVSQTAPGLSGLLGITPMVVFLDIPVDLPFTFGLIPVLGLFAIFYTVCCFPYHSLHRAMAWQWLRRRLWTVMTGVLAIPVCVLSGGMLYALAHDRLPKHVRNAIESFGINADCYTPYPGHKIIHLRGSMIMLICFFIGAQFCLRRIRQAAPFAARHPAGYRMVQQENEQAPIGRGVSA